MFSLLGKIFDSNEKEITKLSFVIGKINALEVSVEKIKDIDFPKRTKQLRERIVNGETLDTILPEAFAYTREAAKRTLGLRHFDEQLMAASVLSDGKIAEQKTGEGKTMSAVPALYLHSLTGKNVHLVTVNDYLARRDAGWMGPIFHLLGVSISSIINNDESFLFDPSFSAEGVTDSRLAHLRPVTRKEAYKADVVYGINSEFGFDYLRDNRAQSLDEVVQRGFYFAVVDEVDSVLIDEARTPHILSAPDEVPTQKYYEYALLVEKLTPSTDYKIDEKLRTAHLSDHGISKIEKLYGVTNIYEKDFDTVYHLEAALKARTLFHREKDYIIKDNQVILIDEFTGRLMIGRRLSEGLHQALEAKEKVPIQRESKTLATVSLQNYFRMYEKLAGMTGTAVTEAEEFHKIYKLDVVVIPTHRKMVRTDLADAVYKTNRGKIGAIADLIETTYKTGQPILVGTTAIDKNEIISEVLRRRGIKHQVLNAKNHEKEAEIIAGAGAKGAVTVATNMAGRGVDIILGGESPKSPDESVNEKSKEFIKWKKEHDEVVRLGGLMVIGTERHESRRIDNQLRGRSGRQGDPGTSQFFVGLDDDIMRLFGGDTIAGLMTKFNMPENVALQHGLVSRAIEQAQRKVEGFNFDIRKHLVEYDDVLNKQREIIYKERRRVLEATEKDETLKNDVIEKIKNAISSLVTLYFLENEEMGVSHNEKIIEEFSTIIPFDDLSKQQLNAQLAQRVELEEKIDFLTRLALDIYAKREDQLGIAVARQIERFVLLSVIDTFWMDHLDAIEHLRGGIQLRGYAQKDPLVEYKNEAYQMFERLMGSIDDDVVHRIYKIQVQSAPQPHVHTDQKQSKTDLRKSVETLNKKLGRNDPCPCGAIDPVTNKPYKYKKCGMIQSPHHKA